MTANSKVSAYRVEKIRSHATVTLSSGETVAGCFFLSPSSAHQPGPERVGELLNAEPGFLPFEVHGAGAPRTVLFNRAQIQSVMLTDDEEAQQPGYDLARRHLVTIGLTHGPRVLGTIRVFGPEGRDRLSDWTRDPEPFRYVECDGSMQIVNLRHVIDVSEASR